MAAKGFDYAGGRPSGRAIRDAGGTFVCRYLTDGGPSLPGKQLIASEVRDLQQNGIAIVCNYETYADRMKSGYDGGKADAQYSNGYVAQLGLVGAPVYFSADWDTTEADQTAVNDYLRGASDMLGKARVGIYGGFWSVSRALDAGVCTYAWQTAAWSGSNRDTRMHIFQDTDAGYVNVAGVQCDVDYRYPDDFGQYRSRSNA